MDSGSYPLNHTIPPFASGDPMICQPTFTWYVVAARARDADVAEAFGIHATNHTTGGWHANRPRSRGRPGSATPSPRTRLDAPVSGDGTAPRGWIGWRSSPRSPR